MASSTFIAGQATLARDEDPRSRSGGVRAAAGGPGDRPRGAAGRARCWCAWSPAASATPTSTRPRAPIRRATRRPCSGMRAPGVVERVGEGVTPGRAGRPRRHAVLAAVRQVRPLPEPEDEPLPGHPRAAEPGLPARRHRAAVARRRADPPLHGHQHVRRVHRDAGDRARQGLARGPAGAARALFACGLSTGLGAAINTARVEPGSTCVVFGARDGRPGRRRRLPAAGRRADRLRRPVRGAARAGARPGRDGHDGRRRRRRRADRSR